MRWPLRADVSPCTLYSMYRQTATRTVHRTGERRAPGADLDAGRHFAAHLRDGFNNRDSKCYLYCIGDGQNVLHAVLFGRAREARHDRLPQQ